MNQDDSRISRKGQLGSLAGYGFRVCPLAGAVVGRELRMVELKGEVNALCVEAGKTPRYEPDSGKG